ncbi:ankyrin repeat domain-containing protein [Micromonospora sp. NPDC000207]|uniref:ankyrin repeat domain-containing protein n=1 Tax=Micromonospora sp. NPDC000207 TaxID=3154246 RepID=UPI00331E832A
MNRRRGRKFGRRLVEAARSGAAGQVADLLRAGVDPDAVDVEGTTALYAAAVQNEVAVVRLLLAAGASPDRESGHGTEGTPLCAAACWGHHETVSALLAGGADPGLREDHGLGRSPLTWALLGPHPETVAVLRAAGARTDR